MLPHQVPILKLCQCMIIVCAMRSVRQIERYPLPQKLSFWDLMLGGWHQFFRCFHERTNSENFRVVLASRTETTGFKSSGSHLESIIHQRILDQLIGLILLGNRFWSCEHTITLLCKRVKRSWTLPSLEIQEWTVKGTDTWKSQFSPHPLSLSQKLLIQSHDHQSSGSCFHLQ